MKLVTDCRRIVAGATGRRGGYITLEAALVLPVFIIAVLSLGYYIKVYAVMENVTYSMMDEASKLAAEAYVIESAPLFKTKLKKRIMEETPEAEELDITGFRYLYNDGDLDDMIYIEAGYKTSSGFPMGFDHVIELSSRVKCRGFTGVRNTGVPMSFEEMESVGVWEPVWIFPENGEKFHSETCSYVMANAREMVLNREIKRKYTPCSLCDAEKIATGSYIYCFTDNGTAYHHESCRQVTRYTVEINRDDALSRGYSPCNKCGGG